MILPPGGASGLGPAGRNTGVREEKTHAFFHLGPLVSKFPTLLTRWQQLAVAGFSRAEDQTAAGPVVVGGLAGRMMGADAGVPLVPREASTIGLPIVVAVTLCGRGRGQEVDRLYEAAR